jgi:septum formation protein
MPDDFIYLASASPRRRELLQQIGVRFRVAATAVDESVLAQEAPRHYVERLALAKAQAAWQDLKQDRVPVLAADTTVVADGTIMGKPADRDDYERMMRLLSGRSHEVLTAIALRTATGIESRLCVSEVVFRAIDAGEIERYWRTGEPSDKAGGYAIQGLGAVFITGLRGSFSGVMGLPLFETAQLLDEAGVARWGTADRGAREH